MNYFKIPKANPFWFVPSTSDPGIHFDDAWMCERIKDFETKAIYRQKWIRSRTTPVQVESSIAPQDLMVVDENGDVVKSIEWGVVFDAGTYAVYEAIVDFTDLDPGVYYLYALVDFLSISFAAITEPIHVKDDWGPNLLMIKYYNTFNDFDLVFTNGLKMYFFIEAAIMEFTPDRDRTAYVNQVLDTATLKGVPARTYKLWVGDARGVAEWAVDILNRIWVMDRIALGKPGQVGKLYQSTENSKWDINRVKGYPMIGATLEIVEARNLMSLEFSDTAPLTPGVVTAYEYETDFFGPAATVQVLEVEENG